MFNDINVRNTGIQMYLSPVTYIYEHIEHKTPLVTKETLRLNRF